MKITDKIAASKLMYGFLTVSLVYFLYKGFQYALLGSYVPLLFIGVIGLILVWSFIKSDKAHRRALRFWAILLLIWAIVRLLLGLFLVFDTSLTESHLREQFGVISNVISVLMLIIGIRIFMKVKVKKE